MDAWRQRELYQELPKLVGQADFRKLVAALKTGLVGPLNQAGLKKLNPTVRGFTHELKIGGSAQRVLGKLEKGVIIFSELIRGGLH
jgi:hypothetical protein